MKKTILLLLTALVCLQSKTIAQPQFIGSEDFGRIFSMTYDNEIENRLYATSLNNHILVSNDNGNSWDVFLSLSFQEIYEFRDLRILPDNSALTVIKYNLDSSDNSLLFIDIATQTISNELHIPYPASNLYIDAYSVSASNPDTILINAVIDFGTTGLTFYTTDAGLTWQTVYDKSEHNNISVNSVAISPTNPQTLAITRGYGPTSQNGGLLLSNDGGQTWTESLEGQILHPVAFNPFNDDEIYVGTGISFGDTTQNLYQSIDGGLTWEAVPMMWTEGFYDSINFIGFNPHNEGQIIVLEENEILVSENGGNTWQSHVYDDFENLHTYYSGWYLSFNPFNSQEVFINSDNYPMFSTDAGATVQWSKNNFFRSTGNLALYTGAENHLYYGVQFGYVHKNLQTLEETHIDILPLNFITQSDAPPLFIDKHVLGRVFTFSSGWFGADLFVSIDHGLTKFPIYNTYMNFVDAVASNPHNLNQVWASLSNTMGDQELIEIDLTNLEMTSTQTLTSPAEGSINGIWFDPQNEGYIVLTIGAEVYISSDNGNNWTQSSNGLEALSPEYDLIINLMQNPLNTQQLTIATNQGVFTSYDKGQNWEQLNNQLTFDVWHSTATDGHIVSFSFTTPSTEFSVAYTSDGGENWESIDSEILYKIASSTAVASFDENSASIYIGSVDLGLMYYEINFQTMSVSTPLRPSQALTVYPNPASKTAHLTVENEEITMIVLTDSSGKVILTSTNAHSIDVSRLANGLYFINATTASGKNISTKLLKN